MVIIVAVYRKWCGKQGRIGMGDRQIKSVCEKGAQTVYYEWIRLIACFLVIFNHLKGYVLFMNASGVKRVCYIFSLLVASHL